MKYEIYSWNETIWTIEDDISVKIAINYFIFVLFRKSKKNEYLVFVCYDAIWKAKCVPDNLQCFLMSPAHVLIPEAVFVAEYFQDRGNLKNR